MPNFYQDLRADLGVYYTEAALPTGPHALDTLVADLTASVPISLELAEPYTSSSTFSYVIAGAHPAFAIHINAAKMRDIEDFRGLCRHVYEDELILNASKYGSFYKRSSIDLMTDEEYGKAAFNALRDNGQGVTWEDLIEGKMRGGAWHGTPLLIDAQNSLYYFHELPAQKDMPIGPHSIYAPFVPLQRRSLASPMTKSELATLFREQEYIDLSEHTLGHRFADFYGMAQLEASRLFLRNLGHLVMFGRGYNIAMELAAKHEVNVVSNDYMAKIALHHDIAEAYKESCANVPFPDVQALLQKFADHSQRTVQALQESMLDFKTIYDNLDYPLPLALDELPFIHTKKDNKVTMLPQREQIQTVAPEIDKVTLSEEEATLIEQYKTAAKTWQLTSNMRKKVGLADIQHALVTGYAAPAGSHHIPGMNKEEAQHVVDLLWKCNALGRDANGKQQLAEMLARYTALDASYEDFCTRAKAAKYTLRPVTNAAWPSLLTSVKDLWPAYRQLISRTWPRTESASQVTERIQALLFEPTPRADSN